MASWQRDGIAGLQSVVLYSLPELDGAIDTVPLGGLVGDSIFLVPERVRKLAARLRKWVSAGGGGEWVVGWDGVGMEGRRGGGLAGDVGDCRVGLVMGWGREGGRRGGG